MEQNNKYELVKYVDGEFELEINVSPKEETIWMTANQMALLFDKDEKTIRKHINNVFRDGELVYDNNTQKMRVVGVKQLIKMYSLNVIISVGYRDKSVISRHIKKIFVEKELYENSVVAKNATTASDGKTYMVSYYNLDMIISIGYRINSIRGVIFRKWANKVLKDYLIKGYAVNNKRLEYLEKTIKLLVLQPLQPMKKP